jgi:shikimate 5-dehydrogenase/shikimate kinase
MEMPRNQRLFEPSASIVLVGCRGAGKRSLGFMGALHLRRKLVTEDHYFEKMTGVTRGKYLSKHGKEAFARRNIEVFKHMLDSNRSKCVIECGMTTLMEEAQDALRGFSRTNPVVYVHREERFIRQLLDEREAEQLLQMDKSHRECSNLEYFNLYDSSNSSADSVSGVTTPSEYQPANRSSKLLSAREDFTRFLDLITGRGVTRIWLETPFSVSAIPPEYRAYSYTLRLRLSSLVEMKLEWEDLEAHGDCVELIIDTWPDDLLNIVATQVASIRRKLRVPIIFSVEENPRDERRRLPDEKDRMDTELLDLGLRLGVEYLSLDLQRSSTFINRILQRKGRTRIIGNYTYTGFGALTWDDDRQLENYTRAQALGCDIVRMTRFCMGDSHRETLDVFRARLQETLPDPKPPLVAYDYSVLGVRTPLQSRILNPIKHPNLENRRDHLATVSTYPNSFSALFSNFTLEPLQFYVVGANVSYSLSPTMHHAAYEFSGMPHKYQTVTCTTLEELNNICTSPTFGGVNLTAPFKVAILPHLKIKSHHATVIGAVNVVLPLRGKTNFILDQANSRNRAGPATEFYGDNTDWSAIHTCLQRAVSPRNSVQPSKTTALVVGAGGMARAAIYALLQLGCRNIFIYNRTVANAVDVAAHFNEWAAGQAMTPGAAGVKGTGINGTSNHDVCHVISSTAQPWPENYSPPTMVISCVPATSADGSPPADFEMPLQWLRSPTGGVVVEVSFPSPSTPFLEV